VWPRHLTLRSRRFGPNPNSVSVGIIIVSGPGPRPGAVGIFATAHSSVFSIPGEGERRGFEIGREVMAREDAVPSGELSSNPRGTGQMALEGERDRVRLRKGDRRSSGDALKLPSAFSPRSQVPEMDGLQRGRPFQPSIICRHCQRRCLGGGLIAGERFRGGARKNLCRSPESRGRIPGCSLLVVLHPHVSRPRRGGNAPIGREGCAAVPVHSLKPVTGGSASRDSLGFHIFFAMLAKVLGGLDSVDEQGLSCRISEGNTCQGRGLFIFSSFLCQS